MNRPELYKKTVDILFDAYFNDTLSHGDFCGCAVGNIIAANMGLKVEQDESGQLQWHNVEEKWQDVFYTSAVPSIEGVNREQHIYLSNLAGEAKAQIDASGYSVSELATIEWAFELAYNFENNEEEMFNGLVNVLNVLKNIHQVSENEIDIQRFRNHYATLTH